MVAHFCEYAKECGIVCSKCVNGVVSDYISMMLLKIVGGEKSMQLFFLTWLSEFPPYKGIGLL